MLSGFLLGLHTESVDCAQSVRTGCGLHQTPHSLHRTGSDPWGSVNYWWEGGRTCEGGRAHEREGGRMRSASTSDSTSTSGSTRVAVAAMMAKGILCGPPPPFYYLLGGVGHCYAWHVQVPFGNVLFLISSNWWFVHVIQKILKKGKISCLFSHPFHIFLFFSYPSFLTIHSPIHPIIFLSFFIFKLLHTLPIVASCLCILTVSW